MQSKTSFFNQTLFRKNLTRFWPLWVVPSFVGALFPLAMLTQLIRFGTEGLFGSNNPVGLEFAGIYYSVVTYALPVISICYAILVALAMWSYLFNNRSTGLMHTLPIGREGLFLTNFLSGMTMMLVPYVVTGALCVIVSLCYGFFEPVSLLITILCVIGESLFYFCTATTVAFVTGNIFALPVLYAIFHFLVVGLDMLLSTFASGFLFGLSGNYSGAVVALSPTVYLMSHVRVNHEYEEYFVPNVYGSQLPEGLGHYETRLVSVTLENAWVVAVYALVGVVLLAVAYALYRRRRSECAGDVVAVGWMKPVFRYGVSICGALLGGLGLYYVFWGNFQNGEYYDVIPMLIAMLIAGAIAYYAASMLLAKSLRVFKGSWKGLGVMALCAVAICSVLKFDLLGFETRVPAVSQIEALTFRAAGNGYELDPEEDAALIEEIRAVHLAIAEDADYVIDMNENWRHLDATDDELSTYNSVRLTYHMNNGTKVIRRYNIPITAERLRQEGTYDFLLDRLINSETMKAVRFHADGKLKPDSGYLYLDTRQQGGVSFGTREALAIHEAVCKDIASGACGTYDWFDSGRADQYAIELNMDFLAEEDYSSEYLDAMLYDSINIAVYPEMTHTVAALLELDLAEVSDLKTYQELYPQEYDQEYWALQEELGYDLDYKTYLDIRDGAASIGIIGGADGPTEVFVTAG